MEVRKVMTEAKEESEDRVRGLDNTGEKGKGGDEEKGSGEGRYSKE